MACEIERQELLTKMDAGAVRLLDAQGPGWFEGEHLPGAIRGRIDEPDGTLVELGDGLESEIIVYCSSATCTGSALAEKLLEGRGYRKVLRYTAGKQDWIAPGCPSKAIGIESRSGDAALSLSDRGAARLSLPKRLVGLREVRSAPQSRLTACELLAKAVFRSSRA